jgi:hypothetical protein
MPEINHFTKAVHRLERYPALMAAALLLAAAGLACSFGGSTAAPGTPAAAGTPAMKNAMAAGLADLASYQATLHLEFEGTKDGARLAWSQDMVLESDKLSSVRALSIHRKGPEAGRDIDGMVAGQFGALSINRSSAGAACSAEAGGTPLTIPDPANLLRPYHTVTFSKTAEERNGISAKKATLNAAAVGANPQAKVTGEVWTAVQGGYIVYYNLVLDGTEADWGKGIKGAMHWEYSLKTAGEGLDLLPPEGCPLGMVEAPQPKDAAEVSNQPGIQTLTTGLDVAAAAKFYQEQLAGLGWTESKTTFLTPRNARLIFTKPDRQLVVNIQAGSPTEIWISLERLTKPSTALQGLTPAPK